MFNYGIDQLTVNKVIAISKGEIKAIISQETKNKVVVSRKKVETMDNGNYIMAKEDLLLIKSMIGVMMTIGSLISKEVIIE